MLARASLVLSLAFTFGPCLSAQSLVNWELVCEDDFEDGLIDSNLWVVDLPIGCASVEESGGSLLLRNSGAVRLADGVLAPGKELRVEGRFRIQTFGDPFADSFQVYLFATGGLTPSDSRLDCRFDWVLHTSAGQSPSANLLGWGGVSAPYTAQPLWSGDGAWVDFVIEAFDDVAHLRGQSGSNLVEVSAPFTLSATAGSFLKFNNRECWQQTNTAELAEVRVYRRQRDCDGDGVDDAAEIAMATALDCNANDLPDACEIALGFATDFDSNGIPDDCIAPLLNTDRTQASVTTGAQVKLTLRAGSASALDVFVILGSASGTVPGLADPVTGLVMPLNFDGYFELLYANSGAGIVAPFFGFLDASGNATATVTVPGGTNPSLVGLHLDHAYLTIDLFGTGLMGLASNPVPLNLVP